LRGIDFVAGFIDQKNSARSLFRPDAERHVFVGDRVIHFAFGFLLVYPMRELLHRAAGASPTCATWLAVSALAALSSFFEIVEAVIAQIVAPDLGAAYLGTQGDIWDAQKDMGAAFVGAVLAAIMLSIRQRRRSAARS
jgi:putative membrane protein